MRFVPKISVRGQLTLTILLAIFVSWVCSTGYSNYLTYRQISSYRAVTLAHPEQYPNPIPQPVFGPREFFLGYPPRLPRPVNQPAPQRRDTAEAPLSPELLEQQRIVASTTAFIVLGIALLAGAWASRRFTRPISKLLRGAERISAGDYNYQISLPDDGEFTELATTLNQMSTRVSAHITQLEQEAETRRHFMADIAHEFRTPITTLKTMAGALEDGIAADPERRLRAARSIVRTSDRLLRLVTDMLELAKLDLHELPLHRQPVDVRELAASCVHTHADNALAAQITLHPVAAGAPIMVDVDPDRLAQTLDNLLNNAISYAGAGAEVSVTFDGTAPTRIIVADTGRGIPAQHLPFISEPFYRADAVRNPGDKHSGLGLRIAKALISAHGGELTIASTEGAGTTVVISLL
ncbi:MAG: HAMP domain-containing sensor histidine kinase [bacterium]